LGSRYPTPRKKSLLPKELEITHLGLGGDMKHTWALFNLPEASAAHMSYVEENT
jgi:hypothetical protein